MAAPGPPQRAGAGPSAAPEGTGPAGDEAAAAAELLMLLGNGDGKTAMVTRLGFLQDALFSRGVSEELARREMLELASKSGNFTAAVAAIDPDISPELCVERGWPASCFTACKCARRCMKILATQDGEFFDEQLRLLREAHAAAEADADARMPRAKRATQILTSSKWRHEMEGVASPMLEALLVDERAAATEAAAHAATGSVEAVIVAVNAALQQKGCCKKGRLALLACSSDYLSYSRKRRDTGARASASRAAERLPVELALLADPCRAGCAGYLSIENANTFIRKSTERSISGAIVRSHARVSPENYRLPRATTATENYREPPRTTESHRLG